MNEIKTERYTLYNSDSYLLIDELIANQFKVDHIITDPPYNISQDNNFGTMKHPRAGVDFGDWDRGRFDLCSWIPKYSSLLNKNGSMIIFCSYRFLSTIVDTLESEESEMIVKDVIIWQKSNPMPRNTERRYVQDMEFAIWAVKKGAKWVFNKNPEIPYMRALYNYPLVHGKERLGHPTQKSLALMKELIKVHTNEGDLILDPFMGSGSTGEAALLLNRKFVGVEFEIEYFNMSKDRLSKYINQ